jgi:hypothetical protein
VAADVAKLRGAVLVDKHNVHRLLRVVPRDLVQAIPGDEEERNRLCCAPHHERTMTIESKWIVRPRFLWTQLTSGVPKYARRYLCCQKMLDDHLARITL